MTIMIWTGNGKKQSMFAILQRATINRNSIDDAYIIIPKPIGFYNWNNISDGKCQILFFIKNFQKLVWAHYRNFRIFKIFLVPCNKYIAFGLNSTIILNGIFEICKVRK